MNQLFHALGIHELYPHQEPPLKAARKGRDIFVRFPTSSGKSLLGQIPALEDNTGYSIVISPLLALQKDQMDKLSALGLSVYCLNSAMTASTREDLLEQMSKGMQCTLIYMAPEQLLKEDVQKALAGGSCRRIIVDEAHMVLHASKKYRPAFKRIGEVIDKLPYKPQIIALTATATPSDIQKIKRLLRCPDAELFSLPVRRENLCVDMVELHGKDRQQRLCQAVLDRLNKKELTGKAIIYCRTRADTKAVYRFLKGRKYKAVRIHGGTGRKSREKRQNKFVRGAANIMVATTAFGLGIDIPDIRLIIHAGLPLTFDGYIQEIGRAGRDGKPADCCLIYHNGDFGRNENILATGKKSRKKAKRQVAFMKKAVESSTCLWQIVDKHFKDHKDRPCGRCPACRRKALHHR